MHGVINLLKPPGMTSHDAVAFVRRALKIKRVGHTGTLDPAAAGVLPICVGQATRLVEYLQAGRKTYIAEATFGYETDTLDGVGQTVREADSSGVTLDAIHHALEALHGEIAQVPPAFSAIKREGRKLYDLARAGQLDESTLAPRQVTIYEARPTRFVEAEAGQAGEAGQRPRALIHVECSSGTYIRSLVRDLGRALGCGATMTFLVRTQSGSFSMEDAVTLEEITARSAGALLPLSDVWRRLGLPIATDDAAAQALAQGKHINVSSLPISRSETATGQATLAPLLVIENTSGTIAALAVPVPDAVLDAVPGKAVWYKPEKVLILEAPEV